MLTLDSARKDSPWPRGSKYPIFTLLFTSRLRSYSTQRQPMMDSDPVGVGAVAAGECMGVGVDGAVGTEAISTTQRSPQSSLAQWEYLPSICTMLPKSISCGVDKPPWTAYQTLKKAIKNKRKNQWTRCSRNILLNSCL